MLHGLIWLFGPVFAKEMVENSRRKRYFVNRTVYGAAILIALMVVWDVYGPRLNSGSDSAIHVLPEFANSMMTTVLSVQYVAAIFFVPIMVAGTIASEREARSLEVVLSTTLTEREIVLGKLASRLTMALVILLSSIPVFALMSFFGGIEAAHIVRLTATTMLTMLCCGAVSIYLSVVCRTPVGAIISSYFWLGMWFLVLLMVTRFFLVIKAPLDNKLPGNYGYDDTWSIMIGTASYLASTLVFLYVARRTMIRRFSDLVGRMKG